MVAGRLLALNAGHRLQLGLHETFGDACIELDWGTLEKRSGTGRHLQSWWYRRRMAHVIAAPAWPERRQHHVRPESLATASRPSCQFISVQTPTGPSETGQQTNP